jgi:DNA-binding cell septation regulator SpoVG
VLDPEILVILWRPYRTWPAMPFKKQPYERIKSVKKPIADQDRNKMPDDIGTAESSAA